MRAARCTSMPASTAYAAKSAVEGSSVDWPGQSTSTSSHLVRVRARVRARDRVRLRVRLVLPPARSPEQEGRRVEHEDAAHLR